jgi:hypothetical protein
MQSHIDLVGLMLERVASQAAIASSPSQALCTGMEALGTPRDALMASARLHTAAAMAPSLSKASRTISMSCWSLFSL